MKFRHALVLICVFTFLAVEITSHRIRSRGHHSLYHRYNRQNPPKGVTSNNLVYQFIMGCLAEVSGAYSLIDGCSSTIPGWATVTNDAEEKKSSLDGETQPMQSKLDKVLGYLGTAINFACSIKDDLISFFSRRRRRFHRLFMQGKAKKFKWPWDNLIDKAAKKIAEVSSGIAAGAKKLKDSVVDGVNWAGKKADEVGQFIKDKLTGVFKPLADLWESLKQQFEDFLAKNPLLKVIFEFTKCFIQNDGVKNIKKLFKIFKSFVAQITSLATPTGWVNLVVNLVCGWEDLRDGINFFKMAWKEAQKPAKYNYYGRATGKFMKAIAGE